MSEKNRIQCKVCEGTGKVDVKRYLVRYQDCGCVICTCDNKKQCQGCGAECCGTHEVGEIPDPIYIEI